MPSAGKSPIIAGAQWELLLKYLADQGRLPVMKAITGLLGRDDLVETVAREARKGRHLLLTGPVGIGKSAILEAVIDRLIVRCELIVLHVNEHQAKGQFLELAGVDHRCPVSSDWHRGYRAVCVRWDADGGGDLDPGVPLSRGGESELATSARSAILSMVSRNPRTE